MVIEEYRGVENLVYAPVTEDSDENYTTGAVKPLAGVAEISRTTESSSEVHYYDNMPAITIESTGSDEITCTVSAIPLDVLADITGQYYDQTLGSLVEGDRQNKYFAIGSRTKGTDGKYRYVWRLKGTFGIPDEQNDTENDGTDTTNTELTFTGIATTHKFTKGKYNSTTKAWEKAQVKGVIVDERFDKADLSTFFSTVQTPDTVTAKSSS